MYIYIRLIIIILVYYAIVDNNSIKYILTDAKHMYISIIVDVLNFNSIINIVSIYKKKLLLLNRHCIDYVLLIIMVFNYFYY